jgi:hypothetical protein
MNLYYNYDKSCFSLKEDRNSKKVFETHSHEGFYGPETIEEGRFKVEIHTNIYPKKPQKEFLRANIYVDGVKLLPVKESIRIPVTQIHFNLHEISFTQYGAGNNIGKEPSTIFLRKDLDWYSFLKSICIVSEQPEKWQNRQFDLLLAKLEEHENFKRTPALVGKLLEIYAPYTGLIGTSIYSKLRQYCISTMRVLLDKMETEKLDDSWLKNGDFVWRCIKEINQEIGHANK